MNDTHEESGATTPQAERQVKPWPMREEDRRFRMSDALPEKLRRISGIYRITNWSSGTFYIGSTKNFFDRFHHHRTHLRRGDHISIRLQHSFNAHPEDRFDFEILEFCDPKERMKKEDKWLSSCIGDETCANSIMSTEGRFGYVYSTESIKRKSDGMKKWWADPENHLRMCLLRQGKTVISEDQKKKISAAQKGRCFSPEHRAKLRLALARKRCARLYPEEQAYFGFIADPPTP